jgi:hypothetical protein
MVQEGAANQRAQTVRWALSTLTTNVTSKRGDKILGEDSYPIPRRTRNVPGDKYVTGKEPSCADSRGARHCPWDHHMRRL